MASKKFTTLVNKPQISDVKSAIIKSGGFVSTIAKRLKCDWHTARNLIEKYGLEDCVKAEKENLIDMAESKLIENVQEGKEASIFFYLKTQAKQRGYIERSEVGGVDGKPIFEINIVKKDGV